MIKRLIQTRSFQFLQRLGETGNGHRFLNQRTVHQIPAISTGEREVSTQSQSEKASTERTSPLFSNEIDT
jgi:hypothetical protein